MEHKPHFISLYAIVVILLIAQIFTMYMLIVRTDQLSLQINQTNSNMNKNQIETNSKINDLTSSLQSTQSSFTSQLAEIKASASSDFSGIIDSAVKSVVTIKTSYAQGTGFIISTDGYIVTNAHVLADANGNLASNIRALTYNQKTLDASFIGANVNLDIALLKISGSYPVLTLGDSGSAKVGEKVIAIGNPYGLQFSVTEGIVSAIDRVGTNNLPDYIQTDAALNPGNSGGPLIDTSGDVIGINNFKASAENIGFALESNYIKTTVNNIAQQALNSTII